MEGEGRKLRWRKRGGNYDGGRGEEIEMEGGDEIEGEGRKLRWRERGGNYDGGRGDEIEMEGERRKL